MLEISSGTISVSFEETLLARYKDKVPRGSVLEFKAKCLKKVIATKSWIYKIGFHKSESYINFLKGLKLDHFKQRAYTTFGFDKGQEILKNASVQHEKLSRDFSKTRTGASEMAQEYDLESSWAHEDLSLLSTGKLQKTVNVKDSSAGDVPVLPDSVTENKPDDIESTFFMKEKERPSKIKAVLGAKKEPTDKDLIPTSFMDIKAIPQDSKIVGDNKNEKIVFKEAHISSTLKGFNTADITGREAYSILESGTRGSRIVDTFSLKELIHEFEKFDPIDVMERYLQKFDPLFREICQ